MNHSSILLNNRGFATLLPVIALSVFALSLAYILQYKVVNFEYSVSRYEKFLNEKYKRQSDENLERLYSSFEK